MPGDDGTIAALITALRLSGGRDEEPVGNGTIAVNRLGPPWCRSCGPWRGGRHCGKFAGRNSIEACLRACRALFDFLDPDSGLVFRIEPERLTLPGKGFRDDPSRG